MKRAHPLRTDSGQIAGIAAVVAAHHEHQIQRLLVEQRDDRVLPFLGCAADGVEGPEMAGQGFLPRSSIAARNISPMASDSDISIVVWLAHPIRTRSVTGSKPAGAARTGPRTPPVAHRSG